MNTPFSYRLTRLNQFAPEQMGEAMSYGAFEHFLLEGTSCDFHHEHWDYGGVVLDEMHCQFGEWIRGQFRSDRVCIGFFKELTSPSWINGVVVGQGDLQLYAERSDLACRSYPQTRWAVIQVPRNTLELAARELLGHSVKLPESGMVNLLPSPEERTNVGEAFDLCGILIGKGGLIASQGVKILLQALVRAIASAARPRSPADGQRARLALQMVKLAELYLAAHLSESYSSIEFARAVGMSERSLELQFKKIFGMSPKRWRQYMGLNIAHRKLGRGPERSGMVAEIAAACGFSHAGRFSAVYRELFGELPVRTRRGEKILNDQQESIFKSLVH